MTSDTAVGAVLSGYSMTNLQSQHCSLQSLALCISHLAASMNRPIIMSKLLFVLHSFG